MKEYVVRIKETLEMTVTVEATSALDARDKVERKWKDGDYILDADNFTGVDFTTPRTRDRER